MQYLITFLEGIISFISPCMLPMLPVYISYFAGNADKKQHTFSRAAAFVLGFTVVFSLLGLFAGTLGAFLTEYKTAVNIVCGLLVIAFGLSYLNVFQIPFFKGIQGSHEINSIFSAFLFGVIYSVSLTPCVGAFLGSALMMASASGTALQGVLLLVTYSLGLGVPFLLSAILIEKLNTAFLFIKKHYKIINLISGIFLIVTGLAIALGWMNRLMAFFS
ncbi:MAG: sulfite exporter TauE/SafE family protein [Ruminococcus sp.]|nr:sulfite exporter TauE/SafE family protein [Ruminococcus sp.]